MTYSVAYQIPLPNAGLQGASTADRPLCALVSAYASWLSGQPLSGAWKLLSHKEQEMAFAESFKRLDVTMERATAWGNAVRGTTKMVCDDEDVPHMGMSLDGYQMDALNQLTASGGVLALGCGLGKTATAFRAAIDSGAHSRIWILCPLNAMPTWERYRAALSHYFPEVQILSMDSAHKFVGASNTGGVIIYDEAHLLGDCDARRTKSCHALRPLFDFGLCLTGTLLHGGIEKTLSIMDLAVPGGALFANRWKAGEYFNCLVRKYIGTRKVTALEKPTGFHKEEFLKYISRLCISLNSHSESVRQSIEIPEQDVHTVKLGEPWDATDVLVGRIVRARLAAGEELPHAQAVAHEMCRSGSDDKIQWLMDLLGRTSGPVVVFAAYRETLDKAQAACEEAGISLVRVDGDVTGAARALCERTFQDGGARVFIGQMDAACVSMNLQNAQVSVALDHTWKAANYNQALARTCRRGQALRCTHYDLVTNELQDRVVARLAAAEDFDASLAEWQALKAAITTNATPSQGEASA